jgi:hypothetical protein
VAEPWSDDFAALDEHSHRGLRSIAATRAHVLSAQEPTKMRFLKNRPALAALLVLALVGVASGAAYAVDRIFEVFIHVDTSKSPTEIEQGVKSQLEAAGVPAKVHATKNGNGTEVEFIMTGSDGSMISSETFSGLPDGKPVDLDLDLGIRVLGVPAHPNWTVHVKAKLDDAQNRELRRAVQNQAMYDAINIPDDPKMIEAVKRQLASHGFHNVDVTVGPDKVTVVVK